MRKSTRVRRAEIHALAPIAAALRSSALPRLDPLVGLLLATTSLAHAQTVPQGGRVIAGGASINGNASALVVDQSSSRAVINWNSFSIGEGASVTFNQPGSDAAILNRVTGTATSTIAGSLRANGQVYLVNPNGIAITPTGTVDVGGGFVASTLGIADGDFMSGRLNFSGANPGSVVNSGAIRVGTGGYAALLGGKVANSGTIDVPLGRIGLGSGQAATLDLSGDGFLQVALPATGDGTDPLVQAAGRLSGGHIELRAATVANALRNAVNVPGELVVRGAHAEGGSVVLDGGAGGVTQVSGTVDAASDRGAGGTIAIGGQSVALTGAKLDARGTSGGTVTIGGGAQGQSVSGVTTADATSIDAGTVIDASGTQGSGGRITVWSNSGTRYTGSIVATGNGGDGGSAEISSHGAYLFDGAVNLLSIGGKAGNLLLDPYNVTISTASDTNQSGFTATGSGANINSTTLQNALATASVTVSTGSSGSEAGNITVSNPVSWSANTTLTLNAAGAIALNAGISNSGTASGLTLTAAGAGGVSGNASGTIANNGLLTVNVNAAGGTGTIAGIVSGTGSLLKAGSGTLVLSGANTYSGGTTISNGTLVTSNQGGYVGGSAANGYYNTGAGTGLITLGDSNTGSNAIAYYFLPGTSPTNNMLVSSAATGSVIIGSSTGTGSYTQPRGSLTLQRDVTLVDGTSDRTSFIGKISGTGNITLATAAGLPAGRITFDNSTNSFVGTVTINSNTILQTNAANVLNNNNLVDNGRLLLRTYNESIGALTGSGLIYNVVSGAAANLTIGANNAGGTFSGTIGDGTTVIKAGTGTQVLAGANNYTGSTIVNGGILSLTGSWNVGSGTATTAVAAGTTLSGNGVITAATLNDSGAGTVNLSGPNMIGTLATSGLLGSLSLVNAQSLTTGSISSQDTIALIANGANSDLTLAAGATLSSPASNTAIILSAGRNFINDAGSTALSAPNGRWLVYSAAPAGDTFGALNSGNTAVWNTSYASSGGSIPAGGNRYVFAYQPTLTFTSTNLSKTYGTDDSSSLPSAYSVSGIQSGVAGVYLGDSAASTWSGAPSLASAGAAAAAPVAGSPYQIGISAGSVTSLDNYALAFNSAGLLTVNPAPLTLTYTASASSSSYGSALSGLSGTVSGSGFVNGEGIGNLGGAPAWSTTATSSRNVGSYGVTGSGLTSGNYTITAVQAPSNASAYTITPAALTITADNASKTYNGTAWSGGNGVSYSGFVNGDTASSLTGTLSYGGAAQGAVNAGSYGLTASGLSNTNYAITWVPGVLTIGKAGLTITGNTTSNTYNGQVQSNGYTITSGQLYGSDGITGVSGLASGTNAGTYADNLSGATGSGLSNYNIGYVNGSLSIGKATLTLTGANNSVVYDGATQSNSGASYSGAKGSDSFTISGYASGKNAGTYTDALGVNANGGTLLSNYNVVVGNEGVLTIGKAGLTITGNTTSSTYNGQAQSNGYTITSGQLYGSDGITAVSGLASGTNAGSYSDNLSGATGSGLSNYAINYVNGSLTIGKAALTVTGGTTGVVYNGAAQTNTFTTSALYGSDSVTGVSGLASGTNAGSYSDNLSGAAGSGLSNYAINYVNGSLTIGKATLTLTGANNSVVYDGATQSNSGASYSGAKGSDSFTVIGYASGKNAGTYTDALGVSANGSTLLSNYNVVVGSEGVLTIGKAGLTITGNTTSSTYNGQAQSNGYAITSGQLYGSDGITAVSGLASGTNAGSYSDNLSGVTGSGLSNYNIGYVNGSLSIGKATLTLTGANNSVVYDGATQSNSGASYTGAKGSDSFTVIGYASGKNSGTYTDALGVNANGGTLLSNYDVVVSNEGVLTIGKAALIVAANSAAKTYDGVAFSGGAGVSYSGFVNGESAALLGGTLAYGGSAQGALNAGRYGLSVSGLTSENYAITYVDGSLQINPRQLLVTANPLSRPVGTANPALTYVVGGQGLVAGDSLSGALATTATQQSPVGSYSIVQGSLAADSNYVLDFVPGVLRVQPVGAPVGLYPSPYLVPLETDHLFKNLELTEELGCVASTMRVSEERARPRVLDPLEFCTSKLADPPKRPARSIDR